MFWLVIMCPLMANAIAPSPAGYNPELSGGYYSNAVTPARMALVPPTYKEYRTIPTTYREQVGDALQHQRGGGQSNRNFIGNGRTNEIVRDAAALTSRNSDGWGGQNHLAKSSAGHGGYYNNHLGATYDRKDHAVGAGGSKYGTAGLNAIDGVGAEGHQKGRRTAGFHKSYNNVESGKDTKFVDEDHEAANKKFGLARDAAYNDGGWATRGNMLDHDLHAGRASQNAGSIGGFAASGAQRADHGSHDVNGYYHNQDLAVNRNQQLAEDNRLARMGLHGMRGVNEKVHYPELW